MITIRTVPPMTAGTDGDSGAGTRRAEHRCPLSARSARRGIHRPGFPGGTRREPPAPPSRRGAPSLVRLTRIVVFFRPPDAGRTVRPQCLSSDPRLPRATTGIRRQALGARQREEKAMVASAQGAGAQGAGAQGLGLAVRVEDLALDDEGRVVVQDQQLAQTVAAALTPLPGGGGGTVVNNCHHGNCSSGCAPR
ncbi:hypothetical protein GCM10027168_20070 [Streptomyces capparidis]